MADGICVHTPCEEEDLDGYEVRSIRDEVFKLKVTAVFKQEK